VDEVGACLFEADACLAYTDEDLPGWLPGLPLDYHLHLPLDLPWERGFDPAWEKIVGLVRKTAFLRPRAYVLHPPPGGPAWLARRAEGLDSLGIAPGALLLENVRECGLAGLWPELRRLGLGACLDLGHLLAYHQADILDLPGLWEAVGMVHLSAPDPAGTGLHLSLRSLDRDGRAMLDTVLAGALAADKRPTLMVELFAPGPLLESLDMVRDIVAGRPEGTPAGSGPNGSGPGGQTGRPERAGEDCA
jgi:hypothetical protein